MKKVLTLLILGLLVGCSKPTIYDNYVSSLKQETQMSENIPFDIQVYMDEVNESRLIYQVVIDNPKEETENLKVLVIHNVKTEDVFPSIGIVDEPITLNETTKGINLIGYVNKQETIEFKILIETQTKKYIYIYNYR